MDNADKLVSLNTILAIISLKIREADIHLSKWPLDRYHKGARDTAVNIIDAIKKIHEVELK